MALLEDGIGGLVGGWSGGLVVGLGALLVAPSIVNAAGSIVRPVAKTLVRGALFVTGSVRDVIAEVPEQVGDLVAEVRAERTGRGPRPVGGKSPGESRPH